MELWAPVVRPPGRVSGGHRRAAVAKVGRRGEERKERADSAQLLFHSISAPVASLALPCTAGRPTEAGRGRTEAEEAVCHQERVGVLVSRAASLCERASEGTHRPDRN